MKSELHNNSRGGLITLAIIIIVLMVAGYVVINNFLQSDKGQEIQYTTDSVIDTIDDVRN